MTPRERWEAAVQLQYEAAAQLAAIPSEAPSADVGFLNRAIYELHGAYNAARDAGEPPTEEEWRVAYSIHRDEMIRWGQRHRRHTAAAAVESQRVDAAAFYQLARRYFE